MLRNSIQTLVCLVAKEMGVDQLTVSEEVARAIQDVVQQAFLDLMEFDDGSVRQAFLKFINPQG